MQNINKLIFHFHIMKKRGQFYLIAGIIIIGLMIGFANISNYLRKSNPKMLYDLKEEIEIESENVLDYVLHQKLSDNDKKNLLVDFTRLYKDNEEKQNLYFIFGDKIKITAIGYQELAVESVYINVGGNDFSFPIDTSQDFNPTQDIVTIKIISNGEEYIYEFELKGGENFYFVISQEIGGERYIIRN